MLAKRKASVRSSGSKLGRCGMAATARVMRWPSFASARSWRSESMCDIIPAFMVPGKPNIMLIMRIQRCHLDRRALNGLKNEGLVDT